LFATLDAPDVLEPLDESEPSDDAADVILTVEPSA
jgi:hypothetical protein